MPWMEKVKFWRMVGASLNTGAGARMARATGEAVNRIAAAYMAPRLAGEVPWTEPVKPLAESRVAVVATAGFHLKDQEPFDVDAQNGDVSFRVIPSDVDPKDLVVTHAHYTHRYVDRDANCVLPVDRLRELAAAGALSLSPRWFSYGFAGTQTRGLIDPERGTAHRVARALAEDGADLVVLVPA
jgi:D-proline reductase (dithiol) PrdB